MDTTPWEALPPTLADHLRPVLAATAAAIIEALAREVPAYARPLEGRFGKGLRRGVELALARFLDLPGTTLPALTERERELYLELGRGELRDGRTLASLLAAYRVGARVAFTRFADAGPATADVLVPLATSVFTYIDELSAVSADGFALEQSFQAGDLDRRREELVSAVLEGTDSQRLASLAAALDWELPERLAVVLAPRDALALGLRLGPAALVALHGPHRVGLLPHTSHLASPAALCSALHGLGAVVGPSLAAPDAPRSHELALLAVHLRERAILTSDPLLAADHLLEILLHRDAALHRELAERALAPLSGESPASRERLEDTLRSWLAHRGERTRVAAELHIHPQTAGYRLTRLRALFGAVLDDPRARLELTVALSRR